MRIQHRIVVLLALVFLGSLLVMSAVMLRVVLPTFDRLDRDQADKNATRVERAIANEIASLDANVLDWAQWTATYDFVIDASPQYIVDNLQPSSLTNLGLAFMAFYDSADRPVWVGGFDPETQAPRSFPSLSDPTKVGPILAAIRSGSTHGLLALDGAHYLISASYILDSDGKGPSRGILILGRAFDTSMLEALTARTEVTFHARPHLPLEAAPTAQPVEIAASDDLLLHRLTLPDITGTATLDLDVETPRNAATLGYRAVRIAAILLLVTALVTMALIGVAIHYLVSRPIRQINQAMREIGSSKDLDRRLAWSRRDELGSLADQFDNMMSEIADARRALLEMTFRLGRSDLVTGMFHNLRNAMSPLTNQLHRAQVALEGAADAHLERTFDELKDPASDPDRKARLLAFLASACEHDRRQRATARGEIDAATGQIRAIELILNQQQAEASDTPGTEILPLPMLVSESLRLFGKGQLAAVTLELDPSLAAMPHVAVQRLPMIHVLYNVFANALTAIERQGDRPGHILVRAAAQAPTGFVRLEIIDNGIGVEVALLEEIFRHGYTTKPSRKGGEGLHWCANTLAAAGGRIWAESAGIGNGMTIMMELPADRQDTPIASQGEALHAG